MHQLPSMSELGDFEKIAPARTCFPQHKGPALIIRSLNTSTKSPRICHDSSSAAPGSSSLSKTESQPEIVSALLAPKFLQYLHMFRPCENNSKCPWPSRMACWQKKTPTSPEHESICCCSFGTPLRTMARHKIVNVKNHSLEFCKQLNVVAKSKTSSQHVLPHADKRSTTKRRSAHTHECAPLDFQTVTFLPHGCCQELQLRHVDAQPTKSKTTSICEL